MKQKNLIAIGIVAAAAVVVVIMLLSVSKPTSFEVKDGNLIIGGSFGVTVPLSEISALELTDAAPKVAARTNGSGAGTAYKGEFTLEGDVNARIYADASKPPFITFRQGGMVFFISAGSAEETQTLFEKLSDALN